MPLTINFFLIEKYGGYNGRISQSEFKMVRSWIQIKMSGHRIDEVIAASQKFKRGVSEIEEH